MMLSYRAIRATIALTAVLPAAWAAPKNAAQQIQLDESGKELEAKYTATLTALKVLPKRERSQSVRCGEGADAFTTGSAPVQFRALTYNVGTGNLRVTVSP